MTPAEIRKVVQKLNASTVAGEEEAWSQLRSLGVAVVPLLREAYPKFRRWQGRDSLVFHSIRYGRVSEDAFLLGMEALNDRAMVVRYRACALLAYSLRRDAIPSLKALLETDTSRVAADIEAAMLAISEQNHHLFMDRDSSGRVSWTVNEED
jgi:hypothetical protein